MTPTPNAALPQVTFIVPAFNAAHTLPDTLRALLAQTNPHWRAIIINDGSTDATANVAASFSDPRFSLITQSNKGLAGARNTGVRAATTPLISFLDADDTIDPRFIELMLPALADHDIVACAFEMTDAQNQPLHWITRPAPHDSTLDRLIQGNAFVVTNLARRERLLELASLHTGDLFNEHYRVLEDWDLWLRATSRGLSWAPPLNAPLFRYRLSQGLSHNTRHMHETGLKVIAAAPVPGTLKPAALRRWHLRNAARALANDDPVLSLSLLEHAEPLTHADLITLAETLRPAFQRAQLVPPRDAHAHHPAWRSEAALTFSHKPWLSTFLTLFDTTTTDWPAIARHIAAQLRPAEIPTIFGLGWNGQQLLTELAALLPTARFACIDDNPNAAPSTPAQRITITDLTPNHALIISPNNPAPILTQLTHTNARILWHAAFAKDQNLAAA